MALPITALYAGLMTLWLVFLAAGVIRQRRRHRVSLGDGEVSDLTLAMRAHGNAAETLPLALIGLGVAEGMGSPSWLLHMLGLGLVAGRILHGLYFMRGRGEMPYRVYGMALTLTVLGILGVGLVAHGLADLG